MNEARESFLDPDSKI